ncbi:hypothetical protein H0H87_005910 [Tephrocybe sp. NHM501043]|nr:hypothetical protein H0H87_005910 [Tephrocybe sp. NHM501043]
MFRSLSFPNSFFILLLTSTYTFAAIQASVDQLAADYGLTTSTSLPFPSATQSTADAQKFIVQDWSLGKGAIQTNPDNLAFVADPFPTKPVSVGPSKNVTGPVLQATYPQGSFSSETGGAQFYNLWNATAGAKFQTMMITYEVAFDEFFDWVKGGKLPGLRGSTKSNLGGCSSGKEKDSATSDCFNVRLMWRKSGNGEVYASIPTTNNLCSQGGVSCAAEATTLQRGSFGFVSGQWNRVTLLVRLNDPPNVANGNIQLFYNDLSAIDQQGLQLRSNSGVYLNGFYFSTFFGGSDNSWATPNTTHTYYRNIMLYGSSAASNLTGNTINGADRTTASGLGIKYLGFALAGIAATIPIYVASQQASVEQLAAQYGLTTSTTLPFPSATQSSSDTQSLLVSSWSLGKGRIQDGPNNLAFVADPFPNNPTPISSGSNNTGPVLQATYPENSFGSSDSGAQFINLWNATDGSSFNSMLVTYEVAFDAGFDWVKGGKLPGLRGGLNSTGCSGGNQSDGKDCFSTRLMWRKSGSGEVYAYIPTPNNLCSTDGITCNSDFGVSLQRGAFGFVSGG